MLIAFGIIYTFGGGLIGFGIGLVVYFFLNGAWSRGGAWPEAWWRLRGVAYRQFYIILPNRRIGRPLVKESDLVPISGMSKAEINIGLGTGEEHTGDYFTPTRGEEMFANPHGAPASLHNWYDGRAIPIEGREPDVTQPDGKKVPKAKVDPFLVHTAFKDEVFKKRRDLNVKQGRLKWGIFGFLLALTFILEFVTLYELLYYNVNIACAVHSKAC